MLPEGFKVETAAGSLLPEGYDPSAFEVKPVEAPSDLLPKDYKPPGGDDSDLLKDLKLEPVEIDASFLPPGFKIGQTAPPEPEKPVEVKKQIKLNFW